MPASGTRAFSTGHLGVEHVARDLQEGRAGRAVVALAEGHRHHVGDARGVRHGRGELGDRRHHVDVRQVLERAHLVLAERSLAADEQHGLSARKALATPVTASVVPGPGGDDGAAGLAGDPRVAVGGVRGHLLVAYVDDVDALVDAAVVDVDDVAAAERVDHLHALRLECLGDQVTAGYEVLAFPAVLAVVGHGLSSPFVGCELRSEQIAYSRRILYEPCYPASEWVMSRGRAPTFRRSTREHGRGPLRTPGEGTLRGPRHPGAGRGGRGLAGSEARAIGRQARADGTASWSRRRSRRAAGARRAA